MKSIWVLVLFFLAGFYSIGSARAESGFDSFKKEADRFSAAFAQKNSCTDEKMMVGSAAGGYGGLYGCIAGTAETAKYFINEDPKNSGQVLNIKIMWNDWFQDMGYGLHPDKREALSMIDIATGFYTPEIAKKVKKVYIGNKNAEFKSGGFVLTYSSERGPAIDEHLLVITEER